MRTNDGRHFEIYPDGHPDEDDPAEEKVDTARGLGAERPRIEHQTLCGDAPASEPPASARSLKEALEHAPTQAIPTSDAPASLPKYVPSVNPTQQFFLTGRVKSDPDGATDTSRGRMQAKTFLGIGSATNAIAENDLPTSLEDVKQKVIQSNGSLAPESYAMKLAKMALMRTMNFLDYLILKSPRENRASLERRKVDLVVPRHLPGDEEIYRFEYYAQSIGYYGPVLWFIPPNMTMDDLVAVGMLSETWWRKEPNFPEGFTTLSPFDLPLGLGDYTEPGYWVMAIPGIIPGTTAKTFEEQRAMLPDIARLFGLELENGGIHPKHRMGMYVRGVVDILYFCAIAQHSKEWLTNVALTARTSNTIKAFHKDETPSDIPGIKVPAESLYSKCRACIDFPTDRPLSISDIVDPRRSQGVGLIVFVIPKVYM